MPLPSPILDSDLALNTLPVPDFAAYLDANYPDSAGDFDGNEADITDAVLTLGAASSVLDSADSDFADVISIAPALDTSAIDATVAQFDGTDVPNGNAVLTEMGGVQAEWTPSGVGAASGPTAPGAGTGGASGAATLQAVGITSPGIASIGDTVQFRAFANYSDGTQLDVTSQATWISSAPATIAVDATGAGKANAIGQATISATFQGMTGHAGIAVQAATTNPPAPGANLQSVAVAQIGGFPVVGQTFQEVIWGTYSDSSQRDVTASAQWQSSNPGIASVDANGLITFNSPGDVTITGTVIGFSSSTTVTVIANVPGAPPPTGGGGGGDVCSDPNGCIDPNTGNCLPSWQCPAGGGKAGVMEIVGG